MFDGDDSDNSAALDDVAFLARSPNRVVILDALSESPSSRSAIVEETGVSRPTLDRIVNEFETRGWVERHMAGGYRARPTGRWLLLEFLPVVRAAVAIRRLGEALDWLPSDLDIGLEHFADATVRRPENDDPMAFVDWLAGEVRSASEFHGLTQFTPPDPLGETMHDCVVSGDLTGSFVLTDALVSYLEETPARRARWREMLEVGVELYQYDDVLPCNLWILDDVVLIKQSGPASGTDSYGAPIVSENETVVAWARDYLDNYRNQALHLEADVFSNQHPESD